MEDLALEERRPVDDGLELGEALEGEDFALVDLEEDVFGGTVDLDV